VLDLLAQIMDGGLKGTSVDGLYSTTQHTIRRT
jgi:hypothetical protein